MQRIFLSYRSPWRKYYYAKSGRMKGGIAERAISGSGWNWYMARGSANLLFKSREPFALGAIAMEKNREHKAGSAAIGKAKAHCAKNAETPAVAGSKNGKSEKIVCNPAIRMEKTETAGITSGTVPASYMSGGSEIQKTGERGKNNLGFYSGASVNAPGDGAAIRTESAGFPSVMENAAPSQAGPGSVRTGGVLPPGGLVVDAGIRAAANAAGTDADVSDMAGGICIAANASGSVPGSVNASQQSANTAPTTLARETKIPQDADIADDAPAAKTVQAEAGASAIAETILAGTAFIGVRMPDARPIRIRNGPGYLGSGQKKTVQLKTAQGAADVPQ